MIKPCTCQHEFQDKRYGKGMRAHTYSTKTKEYRCTVCHPSRFSVRMKSYISNWTKVFG